MNIEIRNFDIDGENFPLLVFTSDNGFYYEKIKLDHISFEEYVFEAELAYDVFLRDRKVH